MKSEGMVIWLTGPSGVGKTTLANGVAAALREEVRVEVLDGDELRSHLTPDLGFERRDREEHVRRTGYIARLLGRNGVLAIVALISPYRDGRRAVRDACDRDGVSFLGIHVTAPLNVLIARDPKRLYARALRGELKQFTGVSDIYEAPESDYVRIDTEENSRERTVSLALEAIARCRRGVRSSPSQGG